MSSLLVCAQPATGISAPVALSAPALIQHLSTAAHLSPVAPASRLQIRCAPELIPTGIAQLDVLTGGLPRGCLTEIYGPASSGRTSILLATIAAATRRQEACALVDVSNAFDPHSAAAAAADLQQLLWVRCDPTASSKHSAQGIFALGDQRANLRHADARQPKAKSDLLRLTQALKTTDLLVQSGGFGLITIDLGDLPHSTVRRIPLTSWFRFRRAVESTRTVLLVMSQAACARTCASLLLRLETQSSIISSPSASSQPATLPGNSDDLGKHIVVHNFPRRPETLDCLAPAHARLLQGIRIRIEVERSRLERKPAQSDKANVSTRRAWYG
jgi:recombination protein RecA